MSFRIVTGVSSFFALVSAISTDCDIDSSLSQASDILLSDPDFANAEKTQDENILFD